MIDVNDVEFHDKLTIFPPNLWFRLPPTSPLLPPPIRSLRNESSFYYFGSSPSFVKRKRNDMTEGKMNLENAKLILP